MNNDSEIRGRIQLDLEAEANEFNLKCLGVLCGIVILCAWLNRIGVFVVDHKTMSIAVVLATVFFSVPIIIWAVHDWVIEQSREQSRETIFRWPRFKYIIVLSSFAGIAATCVVLTFHAVLLMVLPGVFAAQYAYRSDLNKWTLLGTTMLVLVSVYGGFFFGLPDRNFFPDYSEDAILTFADRLALCPPQRLIELFEHYVVPRFLSIFVIDIVLWGVARRNADITLREAWRAGEEGVFSAGYMQPVSAGDEFSEKSDQMHEYAGTEGTAEIPSASAPVKILRAVTIVLWMAAFIMAIISNETGFRSLSALTGLSAAFLIGASGDTQGHYRNISSAYMTGSAAWFLMEACRLAADITMTRGLASSVVFASASEYLSYVPGLLFAVGLVLFSQSEYNQLHFRRMILNTFAIAFMVFMVVQKRVFAGGSMVISGLSRLAITLYFFVIMFTIVLVIIIFFQTKFRGHTFGTNCSAVILVVFNLVELTRMYYAITGKGELTPVYESAGTLGLVIYSWAQSDPCLILRKSEPDPVRPGDHVQNRVIWGAAFAFLVLGSVLFVTGYFDARDIYLILLSVLAYVVIYKSVQAEVYNVQLIEHQQNENRRLEELVAAKTAELEKANDHLKNISETDALTGLHNRRYGRAMMEELTKGGTPFAFMLMDLNHFKQVNDVHGHDAGDQVLRVTAERLMSLSDDTEAVRLGGDEFFVIVKENERKAIENAVEAAELICSMMDQPVVTDTGELLTVTACIGIAVWPYDAEKYEELYQLADKSMYAIKHKSKRSAYSIYDGMMGV